MQGGEGGDGCGEVATSKIKLQSLPIFKAGKTRRCGRELVEIIRGVRGEMDKEAGRAAKSLPLISMKD